MKFLTLAFLGICVSLSLCSQYSISSFEGPPFTVKPPAGMYELGALGLNTLENGAQIMAYGDFDNDKYTDIVTVDDSLRTLTIMLYSHEKFAFSALGSLTLEENIAAIIPGDFNYDGNLDLLIVTQSPSTTDPVTNLNFFFRSKTEPFFGLEGNKPDMKESVKGLTQPFVFDVDGDRNLDIMFIEDGVRKFLFVQGAELQKKDFNDFVSTGTGCKSFSEVSAQPFATPHSNAFIDFNGDCAADLFITSVDENNQVNFEIWLRNPEDSKFCLVEVAKITSPISVVSFGDINNDGRLDLIYSTQPADLNKAMSINVLYNTFAKDPSSPCSLGNNPLVSPFKPEAYNSEETKQGIVQVVSLPSSYSTGTRLYSPDPVNKPSKIRTGDINIDGFSDLIFVVNDPQKHESLYGSIILLVNQGGVLTFDRAGISQDDQPYFQINDDITLSGSVANADISTLHAQYASFYDFDELGHLGIWVVVQDKNFPASSLVGIFNFVSTENFILKTLGLNGYKIADSDDIKLSLGGVYYGSSVECKVSDIDGNSLLAKGSQMPHSAYTPLDLPYIFIGLGRTNNYVENFVMGITRKNGDNDIQQQLWTPIIPNSQLIVNPVRNAAWSLDVYVNPTSETILIVFTTLVILVVLGAFIIYLHAKEKEDDEKRREKIVIM